MTRLLLLGSVAVFAAGVVPVGAWISLSEAEGLRWIAAHPTSWTLSAALLAASLTLCTAGLAVFNDYLKLPKAALLAKVGWILFLFGSVFWVLAMVFRLGVAPWAAQLLVQSGGLPASYMPLRMIEGVFHDIYLTATLSAAAIYGLALLNDSQLARGVGWFAAAFGLLMVLAELLTDGVIPGMALIVPLILGLLPLPALNGQTDIQYLGDRQNDYEQ